MKTDATFKEKLKESNDASILVMDYLTSIGKVVTDLTYDDESQKNGYDFLVDGEPCEFKVDRRTHLTERIAFEIVANIGSAKIGGLLRSKAKWLLYYESETGVCHKILLPALTERLQTRGINRVWNVVFLNTPVSKDSFGYCTISLLIPLSFIRNTLTSEEYQKFRVPLESSMNDGKSGLFDNNTESS